MTYGVPAIGSTPASRWLDSHHCFCFGPHYDPENTHYGLLLVSNDDVVAADTGFSTHPTATWRSSPGC